MINIYKIPSAALRDVKKILENSDVRENLWSRNGYTMRDAKLLGVGSEGSYLYVEGLEEFFQKAESQITGIEGIVKIKDKEYDDVKKKFDEESSGALSGCSLFD